MLTTWTDIRTYLRVHYTIEREADGFLELWWQIGEHRQHQTIRAGTAFGGLFAIIASAVPGLDAETALRDNARLAIGAFAIEDGTPILRAGLIAPIDAAALDRTLHAVAHEAARVAQVPRANPFAGLYR